MRSRPLARSTLNAMNATFISRVRREASGFRTRYRACTPSAPALNSRTVSSRKLESTTLSASTTDTASKPSSSRISESKLQRESFSSMRGVRAYENPRIGAARKIGSRVGTIVSDNNISVSTESGGMHAPTLRTHRTIDAASLCAGITIASLANRLSAGIRQSIARRQHSRDCNHRKLYRSRQGQKDQDRAQDYELPMKHQELGDDSMTTNP